MPELVKEFVLAAFDGAEALAAVLVGGAYSAELVLTGENLRWSAERHNQTLWRDGWRNLHETGEVEIGIDLVAAGVPSLITVPHDVGGRSKPRRWSHGN
ncbi:hypothetical protein [Actinosynnema mirum]|uniref:hypothetical protein n=1 Tax=Actinosynnema mirum TaxID=40567 RepID=UPI00117D97F7|nr:hypothetical protein [Actinosynnema mirum]